MTRRFITRSWAYQRKKTRTTRIYVCDDWFPLLQRPLSLWLFQPIYPNAGGNLSQTMNAIAENANVVLCTVSHLQTNTKFCEPFESHHSARSLL